MVYNILLSSNIIIAFYFWHMIRNMKFKKERYKYIWLVVVLLFSFVGYFLFTANQRYFVEKREFNPKFNSRSKEDEV